MLRVQIRPEQKLLRIEHSFLPLLRFQFSSRAAEMCFRASQVGLTTREPRP